MGHSHRCDQQFVQNASDSLLQAFDTRALLLRKGTALRSGSDTFAKEAVIEGVSDVVQRLWAMEEVMSACQPSTEMKAILYATYHCSKSINFAVIKDAAE